MGSPFTWERKPKPEDMARPHAAEIDLGLAISGATLGPGESRSLREIAAFCGCSWQWIYLIEKRALKKLRHPARLKTLSIQDLRPPQ